MTMTTPNTRRSLSPTALGNYLTCARKGQYYQDPDIPRYGALGLSLGSAYHFVLETYGRARLHHGDRWLLDNVTVPDLYERAYAIGSGWLHEATQDPLFVWQDGDDPEKALSQLATMLRVWAEEPSYRWHDKGTDIVDVELKLEGDFGADNHFFVGVIDAAYTIDGYGTVLVDYKTAGRAWGGAKADGDPRKLIQAPLYAEAYHQQTGIDPAAFAYDVMTYGGKFQRIFVDVRPHIRQPFLDRWVQVAQMVDLYGGEPMPTNPESNLCSPKYCSYWGICDMGAGLGQ